MKTIAMGILLAALGASAETREGASVVVGKDEVVPEDLYVAGSNVQILGRVEGDVVAMGGTVDLDGTVTGDLLTLAGTTTITGRVEGSVRSLSGQLVLRGHAGEDVVLVAGNALVTSTASVGRDLVAVAGMAGIRGPVAGNVLARAGQFDLDARIGGELRGKMRRLWLGSAAEVNGDLVYESPSALHRSSGAVLNGKLERQGPQTPAARVLVPLVAWLRGLIGLFLFAVIWLALFPGFSHRATDELRAEPYKTLGAGAMVVIATPVVSVGVFAAGAVVGGWWLGLILLGVLAVALLVSVPLVAQVIGSLLLDAARVTRRPRWVTELAGLVVLGLLAIIPVLGTLTVLAVLLLGLGAQALALPGRVRVRSTGRLDQLPEHWGPPTPRAR